jgi:hypothetical protein
MEKNGLQWSTTWKNGQGLKNIIEVESKPHHVVLGYLGGISRVRECSNAREGATKITFVKAQRKCSVT